MTRNIPDNTQPTLIAPCGLNCRLCHAYTRDRKPCPGCRGDDANKSTYCVTCSIKTCETFTTGKARYCFACETFPCLRLRQLDKRYRTRYGTSVLANLRHIEAYGIRSFVAHQNTKWTCPVCGSMLCMHTPACLTCGYVWNK